MSVEHRKRDGAGVSAKYSPAALNGELHQRLLLERSPRHFACPVVFIRVGCQVSV